MGDDAVYYPRMGWISVVFAHKVIGVAASGELDGEALRTRLLRSVGLDPAAPVDSEQLIGRLGSCPQPARAGGALA